MKICKSDEGYFLLTKNNRLIYLQDENKDCKLIFPMLHLIANCAWHHNEGDIIYDKPFKILYDHIDKFKNVKHVINEIITREYGGFENYKLKYPQYFI